ncbi:MAG: dephospho-CoA kinase [Bacteroidales bacterium]|jgi:dephospho-CoA kinase|nr:dephospho-CoA kinase [Bacteroidales bacterium]
MKLVGLTGGIGCGKTTVLNAFRALGVPCFVADSHAASYYDDPAFVQRVADLLGPSVLTADGQADKRRIANIVFADPEALQQLNALIHPRVMDDFHRWAQQQLSPYVILESAILYEYGLHRHMDCMIAVYLDQEERLRRLQLRDHASRQQLLARMHNQLSAESKMDRADYVILNYEGNPRQRQVAYIDHLIRRP